MAVDREKAGHLRKGLNWSGAIQDISAGATYLKQLGCTKVGITGFCMGGVLTLSAALRCPEINAASAFYGIPGADEGDLTKIKIPIQVSKDERFVVAKHFLLVSYFVGEWLVCIFG